MSQEILTPVTLVILDGWGLAPASKGNAVTCAKTPTMRALWRQFPHTKLWAHGGYVGLPDAQEGNSEAGHINLGAGRVVTQDSVYINAAIADGTFYKNTAFHEAIKHLRKYDTALHLMGLLSSEKSAHATPEHLYALLELAAREKIKKIFLHLFTDGRDSSQHNALDLLEKMEARFKNGEQIATISGRAYAMDRKKKWSNIKLAYQAMVDGEGEQVASAKEAILRAYDRGDTDEFILPSVVVKDGQPLGKINDNDIIFFFNLRSDRAREMTKTFVQKNFEQENLGAFTRARVPQNIRFVAMTDFGPDLPHVLTAFPSRDIEKSLVLTLKDARQIYIAETEKYAHMTYFFNGGYADAIAGEKRLRIASPETEHYDRVPEMSAREIATAASERILSREFDLVAMNFANPDMVGHTGNLEAAIKAVTFVDKCLAQVWQAVQKQGGVLLVTADHGNCEEMLDLKTGAVLTNHTKNQVPFILADARDKRDPSLALRMAEGKAGMTGIMAGMTEGKAGMANGTADGGKISLRTKGVLGDVAPTILELMGQDIPAAMAGQTLFKKQKI